MSLLKILLKRMSKIDVIAEAVKKTDTGLFAYNALNKKKASCQNTWQAAFTVLIYLNLGN